MKPLVRWTIGDVKSIGWETLLYSINNFDRIYPQFNKVICYNNLNEKQIAILEKFNVPLIHQENIKTPYNMSGSGWKLIPFRLNLGGHELWIDNDIVIIDQIPEINAWLETNECIITEGIHGLYGIYKHLIPDEIKFCAGLFGLPPNFDLENQIEQTYIPNTVLENFNEQGLVSAIICKNAYKIIPCDKLDICEINGNKKPTGKCGYHFVGSNRTDIDVNQNWNYFKKSLIRML